MQFLSKSQRNFYRSKNVLKFIWNNKKVQKSQTSLMKNSKAEESHFLILNTLEWREYYVKLKLNRDQTGTEEGPQVI